MAYMCRRRPEECDGCGGCEGGAGRGTRVICVGCGAARRPGGLAHGLCGACRAQVYADFCEYLCSLKDAEIAYLDALTDGICLTDARERGRICHG